TARAKIELPARTCVHHQCKGQPALQGLAPALSTNTFYRSQPVKKVNNLLILLVRRSSLVPSALCRFSPGIARLRLLLRRGHSFVFRFGGCAISSWLVRSPFLIHRTSLLTADSRIHLSLRYGQFDERDRAFGCKNG